MFTSFSCKNSRFRRCFRPHYFATEAPLGSNGATFGLQRSLRCTSKRPKTDSKSATFESQQTLNCPILLFSSVFRNIKFRQKSTLFFSNGGRFEILSYEF